MQNSHYVSYFIHFLSQESVEFNFPTFFHLYSWLQSHLFRKIWTREGENNSFYFLYHTTSGRCQESKIKYPVSEKAIYLPFYVWCMM